MNAVVGEQPVFCGTSGGTAIAKSLTINGTLRSLSMIMCGIGPGNESVWRDCLRANHTLTQLDLSGVLYPMILFGV